MFRKDSMRPDEAGPIKLQTCEEVIAAARLVKKGIIYPLGTDRFAGMPNFPGTPPFQVYASCTPEGIRKLKPEGCRWIWDEETNKVNLGYNSDYISCGMHSGTHMDALSHATVGEDSHWYNGYNSADHGTPYGVMKADASSMLPFFTRGVLLDIAGYKGVKELPRGYGIGEADLARTAEHFHVTLRRGDTVLIHTGYADDYPVQSMGGEPYTRAGLDISGANYLESIGIYAVGSDTECLEQMPSADPDVPQPVHVFLMIENGIHIIESVMTNRLARDRITEFLFVALPLSVYGATASMVDPIAVV